MAGGLGSGGHNRKPTALKIYEGTQRADRLNENEPQPGTITKIPPPPNELNKWGRDEWVNTGEEWMRLGLLTIGDMVGFFAYCREYGNYMNYSQKADETKVLAVKRIYQKMAMDSFKAMKDMMIQFGFTPSSRARLNAPKKPESNPLDNI